MFSGDNGWLQKTKPQIIDIVNDKVETTETCPEDDENVLRQYIQPRRLCENA